MQTTQETAPEVTNNHPMLTEESVPTTPVKRKRGRPLGAKNKNPRKTKEVAVTPPATEESPKSGTV